MTQQASGGHRLSERPEYVEAATQVHDPALFHGYTPQEEPTPVTELKTPTTPMKRPRKVEPVYIAIGAVLLVGLGLFAYRSVGRAALHAKNDVAAKAAAPGASAHAAQVDTNALDSSDEEPNVLEATPAEAAHSFSLGEYPRALAQYRYLAQQNPDAEVYAVMVKVLSARTSEQ